MCKVVLNSFVCLSSELRQTNVYYRNCSDPEKLGVEKLIMNYTWT